MKTATARVKPSIWTTRKLPTVNAVKTAIIIAAALVMSPAVRARPSITADLSDRPRSPFFEDSGDQEDLIVHAQSEDDGKRENRHDRVYGTGRSVQPKEFATVAFLKNDN